MTYGQATRAALAASIASALLALALHGFREADLVEALPSLKLPQTAPPLAAAARVFERLELPLPSGDPFARAPGSRDAPKILHVPAVVPAARADVPKPTGAQLVPLTPPTVNHRYYGSTAAPDGQVTVYVTDGQGIVRAVPGVKLSSGYVVEGIFEREITLGYPALPASAAIPISPPQR